MNIYSYVVARDYGFAPNPFFGYCTLSACKPQIRGYAKVGDYVVGTGAGQRANYLVYVMKISEILSFDDYWNDPRFQNKKPNLYGSRKLAFGDNIYHSEQGQWIQSDSHHSHENGIPNWKNITTDTKADSVLISTDFLYWGGSGPLIPHYFRDYNGADICKKGQGHKKHFPEPLIHEFIKWVDSFNDRGFLGRPKDWSSVL